MQLQLQWWSVLPFAAMLAGIAVLPLVPATAHWWERRSSQLAVALVLGVPVAVWMWLALGWQAVFAAVVEYGQFIALLLSLFIVSGGIFLKGDIEATPRNNTAFLAVGAVLASFVGTTGAAMLLIRPLLNTNAERRYRVHTVLFAIFIVANCGGLLTPLGDPPLFLGFLQGVEFSWTMRYLFWDMLLVSVLLLAMFFLLDSWMYRKEGVLPRESVSDAQPLGLQGWANVLLLGVVVGLVLMSGLWKPGISFDVYGAEVTLPGLLRDLGLLAVIIVSLRITPASIHADNQFSWAPMEEVAKLFAGIFLTIIPVIAMLQAGTEGAFASVVHAVNNADGEPIPIMYFWATGLLSSFLDNAPTYLVFFNTAGGDPQVLMNEMAPVLMAVSAGAVFMGANTYIGNAPNLMVKAIAEDRGIRMPSFFAYLFWSLTFLLPIFLLVSLISFR